MPFFKAAGLSESAAEAALKFVQSLMERVRDIVHDHKQFCQHPVLRHLLLGDKLGANNRPCLLNEFMSLFSLFASFTLIPAPQDFFSEVNGAHSNGLITIWSI